MFVWKVNRWVKNPYRNVEHIHPLMQDDVERILDQLRLCPCVKRVTVFGSSTTTACNPWSDIDIFVEGCLEHFPHPKLRVASGIDVLDDEAVECDPDFIRKVKRDGVVVYERDG